MAIRKRLRQAFLVSALSAATVICGEAKAADTPTLKQLHQMLLKQRQELNELKASQSALKTRAKRAEAKARELKTELERIREQVATGTDLYAAAESAGLEVVVTEPFSRTDYVPEVGRGNRFVGEAFRLQSNDLSQVITTNLGAYVMRLAEKQEVDESEFLAQRPSVEQELLQQRQAEALQLWLVNMYETAEIVDNRHLFEYRF